jgi:uronate dehydrogenase
MSTTPAVPPFNRLLLTGAAGGLGRVLRPRLAPWCRTLRLSDCAPMAEAAAHEEVQIAALEDAAAMLALLDGVEAVVHLGGVSTEQPWTPILQANIVGLYNLYEAARKQGVKRVVFASSNHVTGYYRQDEVIDAAAPVRPDGLYGLSKAFGENLSRLYFDRHGIETVCLRIGSATPAPENRRMLSTWLSHDDLARLVVAALTAPLVGHTIAFGMSDNAQSFWDNRLARHLGYRPQNRSDDHRAAVMASQPTWLDTTDTVVQHQGGVFLRIGPFDEG